MHILGLDLGTVCGAADGPPGGKPNIWTWNLEDAGHGRAARMALWELWLQKYFVDTLGECKYCKDTFTGLPGNACENCMNTGYERQPETIHVFYEQPLTLGALIQMTQSKKGLQTSDERISFDRGLVGILEAVAFNAGIRHIEAVNLHQARKALTKDWKADKAKVKAYCDMLGWHSVNDNESDACCIWNYGCAVSNPRTAHLSTPMFGSR